MVEDFKRNNLWVQSFRLDGVKTNTLSGSIWQGINWRVTEKQWIDMSSYTGCTNDFIDFQSFANWHRGQIGYGCGFEIDKDLLSPGNKSYSPATCVLIPKELNNLIKYAPNKKSDLPVGVGANGSKYRAYLNNEGRYLHLGQYNSVEEASSAYQLAKRELLKTYATKWKELVDPRVYNELMNPQQLWKT